MVNLVGLRFRIPSTGVEFSLVCVVWCQLEVSVSGWSLVQRTPTVWSWSQDNGEALAHWGAVAPWEDNWQLNYEFLIEDPLYQRTDETLRTKLAFYLEVNVWVFQVKVAFWNFKKVRGWTIEVTCVCRMRLMESQWDRRLCGRPKDKTLHTGNWAAPPGFLTP